MIWPGIYLLFASSWPAMAGGGVKEIPMMNMSIGKGAAKTTAASDIQPFLRSQPGNLPAPTMQEAALSMSNLPGLAVPLEITQPTPGKSTTLGGLSHANLKTTGTASYAESPALSAIMQTARLSDAATLQTPNTQKTALDAGFDGSLANFPKTLEKVPAARSDISPRALMLASLKTSTPTKMQKIWLLWKTSQKSKDEDPARYAQMYLNRHLSGGSLGLAAALAILGPPLDLINGKLFIGFLTGLACGGIFLHELGHYLFGKLAGAKVSIRPLPALFRKGTANQRVAFLMGGPMMNLFIAAGAILAYTCLPVDPSLVWGWAFINYAMGLGALIPIHLHSGGGLILRLIVDQFIAIKKTGT